MGTVSGMASNMEFSARVTRAVKAELARHGLTGADLVPVLKIGRNAVYDRLRGKVAFNTVELEQIATRLGIGLDTLFRSAALEDIAA